MNEYGKFSIFYDSFKYHTIGGHGDISININISDKNQGYIKFNNKMMEYLVRYYLFLRNGENYT